MLTIEDLASMEKTIRDLEDAYEAFPYLLFEVKLIFAMAKKEAGITGPILPPAEAPLVEAVAA